MKIQQTFKFRLNPNEQMKIKLIQSAGSCRFVWNKMLSHQKDQLDQGAKLLNYSQLCKELTSLKQHFTFLKEIPSQSPQQTLKNLSKAISDGLIKKKGFPKFKTKHSGKDSFRIPIQSSFLIENNRIKLPKLG